MLSVEISTISIKWMLLNHLRPKFMKIIYFESIHSLSFCLDAIITYVTGLVECFMILAISSEI